MITGVLMYMLVASAPPGWVHVHPDMCKRAYGIDLDGYIVGNGGERRIVRGYCYRRQQ